MKEIRKHAAFVISLNAYDNLPFKNSLLQAIPFKFHENSKNTIIIYNYPKKISPKVFMIMKAGFILERSYLIIKYY